MSLHLFALETAHDLGRNVSAKLGVPISPHEEREFEDGEHKTRPLVSVRGSDVYVVESLYGDARRSVNDKLARLLFFLGALRDASAGRITTVVPYLAYARKDRKTKSRDPVTTRYLAALFEAVGIDRIVVLDVHNQAAYQNAFRCRTEHLEARSLFARAIASRGGSDREIVVLSPDAGGVKRAEAFRQQLERTLGVAIGSAFMEKRRSAGVVSGEALVGSVEGRDVVAIDDLISTGTTLVRAARECRNLGARSFLAAATHGLFTRDAGRALAEPAIDEVLLTDSVPPFRLDPDLLERKVRVLDVSGLLAEAVRRIHEGGSLVDLLES
jgi:ribose-phosphate pyrophosphokinase